MPELINAEFLIEMFLQPKESTIHCVLVERCPVGEQKTEPLEIERLHTFLYPTPALTDGTQHVPCPLLAVIHFLTEISP